MCMGKIRKQTKEIKVSVIIPIYNAESFLRDCLDSVTRQTLQDIEIICVDDGSSDASVEILKEYAKKDDRIVVIEQKHSNAGVARNAALKVARGKYLSFLDADDYYDATMLEKIYEAAEKDPEIDIVIFGADLLNVRKGKRYYSEQSIIEQFCLKENPFRPIDMHQYIFNAFQNWVWNKVFRREFIEEKGIVFDDVKRSNDALFVCCSLSTARKIYILRESLLVHRTGMKTNMQANNIAEPDAFMKAYEKIYERLQEIHGENFELYHQSFYSRAMLSIRYYVDKVRDDPLTYSYIKHLVAFKGEKVFGFSHYDADYYYFIHEYKYSQDMFAWYKGLLEEIRKEGKPVKQFDYHSTREYRIGSHVLWLPRKIKGLFKSVGKNGLSYTLKRILFHLHLAKDNDPKRTVRKKN